MYTDIIVSFLKEIYFNLTFLHQGNICAEINLTVFELKCMFTQGFVFIFILYIHRLLAVHPPELIAITISMCDTGKALVSPAVLLGRLEGFVAFNLPASLIEKCFIACHLEFIWVTLTVATENNLLFHFCEVNCICRPGVFQVHVPILK